MTPEQKLKLLMAESKLIGARIDLDKQIAQHKVHADEHPDDFDEILHDLERLGHNFEEVAMFLGLRRTDLKRRAEG